MPTFVIALTDGTILEVDQPTEASAYKWMQVRGGFNPGIKKVKFWYAVEKATAARQRMLKLGREHAPKLPQVVRIEATNHCNAHCTFCPRDSMTRPKGFMDFALYQRIIDQCVALGVKHVQMHNYGESLLDKMLAAKVGYAKARGIPEVSMITNGSLLDETRATTLIMMGLDAINISVDAAGKETFEATRVGLDYETVTRNIEGLVKLRGSGKKPKVILSFVYQNNLPEIAAFTARWEKIADSLLASNIHNWAEGALRRGTSYFPCHRPWLTTTVLWDGRVSLCCIDLDGQVIVGDLRTQTLAEVWNGEAYLKVRRAHLEQTGPGICLTCDLPVMDAPDWIEELAAPKIRVEKIDGSA
jgi:hypothetical protein